MLKKQLLSLLFLATGLLAQNTLTVSTLASQVSPSSSVTLHLNYAGAVIAGLQLSMPWPTGVTNVIATVGSAAIASTKTLYNTGTLYALTGLSTAGQLTNLTISPGEVLTYVVTMPSTIGTYTFTPTGLRCASLAGTAVATNTIGTTITVVNTANPPQIPATLTAQPHD